MHRLNGGIFGSKACEILVCDLWYIVVVMVEEGDWNRVCGVFVGKLVGEVCESLGSE